MDDRGVGRPCTPPPPTYELSQEHFDSKISLALAASAAVDDDGFEIWDEAAFEAAANVASSGEGGSSSIGNEGSYSRSSQGFSSRKVQQHAVGRTVPPVHDVKELLRAEGAEHPDITSERAWTATENSHRPLPAPGASSLEHAPTYRRVDTRRRPPVRELTPPPEFTPIGASLDGPPYEGSVVTMSYVPSDSRPASPLYSPPSSVRTLRTFASSNHIPSCVCAITYGTPPSHHP